MNVKEIPATIKQGDEIEIQLAPFGEFKGFLHYSSPDGHAAKRPVTQRLDNAAFERVVASFLPEVLVDKEHLSVTGGDTAAYAWVKSLRVDPIDGLMGVLNFTSIGADAVSGRVYRFPSASFDIEEVDAHSVRPIALTSVALTNRNNLPVRCVLNRTDYLASQCVEEKKGNPPMTEIAKALGLAETADEVAILAAIQALVQQAAEANAEILNAEADKFVDDNKDKVMNAAELKAAYLAAPEMAKKFVANFKVAAAPARVTNSAEAKKPTSFVTGQGDVLATYNAMEAGPAKLKFLKANASAIHAARVAADAAE